VLGPDQEQLELGRIAWRLSPALMAQHLTRGAFLIPRHIGLLDRILVRAATTPNQRTIVSMPPRHGKSHEVSRWFPVWYLSTFPDRRVGQASYGAELAIDFGRFIRDRVKEHAEQLGIEIDPESSAADRWDIIRRKGNRIIKTGGGLYAVGVGGGITGRGVHFLNIDDPVKGAAEAFSQAYREKVWNWWQSDISTRLEPGGSVVLTMTRWHDDDLAGRLLKRSREEGGEQWTEIRIPALCESEDDPLGRQIGEALWPERYDSAWLEHLKRQKDPWVWAALYQQRPITDVSGTGLTEADIQRWTVLPRLDEAVHVQTWDTSFKGADPTKMSKTDKRSKTSGQVWLFTGGKAYLIDRVCRHMDFNEQEAAIVEMRRKWPRTARTYIEDEANGAALVARLSTQIPGVIPVVPKGSKFFRFSAVTGYFRSGNVLVPQDNYAPWVRDFVATLLGFPNVDYDDDVDACSQVLAQEFLPEEPGEMTDSQRAQQLASIDWG
jgi:predicted phage terminase large subunit-like protein